jgi:hypothetical protein
MVTDVPNWKMAGTKHASPVSYSLSSLGRIFVAGQDSLALISCAIRRPEERSPQ